MAKVHTYTKFVEEPNKVVTVHLASEDEPGSFSENQASGNWKELGSCVETISQTLENSRPGSKFPLFHRIGGETPISKLEVDLLAGELNKIKTALKKLPLSESRVVRFRKGKADVKQVNEKDLANFRGTFQSKEDPIAKNLYESFKKPIDLHLKMCKEAKKASTGLHWRVVESRKVKKNAKPRAAAVSKA